MWGDRLERAEVMLLDQILSTLRDILATLRPRLVRLELKMPANVEVGKAVTGRVQGVDQFGNDFPIDFTANPVTWSEDNTDVTLAAGATPDTESLTGFAVGSTTITAACAGFSASDVMNVTAPTPVLSGIKIVFQ